MCAALAPVAHRLWLGKLPKTNSRLLNPMEILTEPTAKDLTHLQQLIGKVGFPTEIAVVAYLPHWHSLLTAYGWASYLRLIRCF